MGYYERHPGQAVKDGFGPYLVWFVIVGIGLWPHFVWHGVLGWVVTGIWLGAVVIPITVLMLVGKAKSQPRPQNPGSNNALHKAQKQAVQFNAPAKASAAATVTGSDPAVKLRKLQQLRDADLLSQEEYETKRTEVINSI
jgi:hypothetical protein